MAHGFVEMQHQRAFGGQAGLGQGVAQRRVGVFGEGFQAVDIDMGLQVRQLGSGHVAHAHGASQSGIAVGGPADDGVHQLTLFGQPVRLRRQPGAQLAARAISSSASRRAMRAIGRPNRRSRAISRAVAAWLIA